MLIFNNRLDAAVTGLFMVLVTIVVVDASRVWWRTLRGSGRGIGHGPERLAGRRAVQA